MDKKPSMKKRGFTIVELMVVLGILLILASISIPNYMEAAVRTKVAKVSNNLRVISSAVEMYHVDYNSYPIMVFPGYRNTFMSGIEGSSVTYFSPSGLFSPIMYLTSNEFAYDVFGGSSNTVSLLRPIGFGYFTSSDLRRIKQRNIFTGIYSPLFQDDFINQFETDFGSYVFVSIGPDKLNASPHVSSYWTPYDPTNGTVSFGNIHRGQRTPGMSNLGNLYP